jgi:predicted nucleotidyltransferase
MKPESALDNSLRSELTNIFFACPEIIAVYLFGSYLGNRELARDIDLAILLKHPSNCEVEIYMD